MRLPLFVIVTLQATIGVAQRFDYKVCIPEMDTLHGQKIVMTAGKIAEPEGGTTAMYSSIIKFIHLEDPNKKYPIDSHVDFTFVIDEKGNMGDICLFRKNLWAIDEPAFKKKFGKWTPAMIDGKPVPFRVMIHAIVDVN
jgi:hypothetical protein